jgi:hypothetical protein
MIKTSKIENLAMEVNLFQKKNAFVSYSIKTQCSTMIFFLPLPKRYSSNKIK